MTNGIEGARKSLALNIRCAAADIRKFGFETIYAEDLPTTDLEQLDYRIETIQEYMDMAKSYLQVLQTAKAAPAVG